MVNNVCIKQMVSPSLVDGGDMVKVKPSEYAFNLSMSYEDFNSNYLPLLISQIQNSITTFEDYYFYGSSADVAEYDNLTLYDFISCLDSDSELYELRYKMSYYKDEITNKYGYTFTVATILDSISDSLDNESELLYNMSDEEISNYLTQKINEFLNYNPNH